MNIYQKTVLITLLYILVLTFLAIYGTFKHWNYETTMKIVLPVSVFYLVALLIMLHLPWWLIIILTIAAIIASLGYAKSTVELGQFIRERFFRK